MTHHQNKSGMHLEFPLVFTCSAVSLVVRPSDYYGMLLLVALWSCLHSEGEQGSKAAPSSRYGAKLSSQGEHKIHLQLKAEYKQTKQTKSITRACADCISDPQALG